MPDLEARDALIEQWHPNMKRMAYIVARKQGLLNTINEFLPYAEDALIYSAEHYGDSKGASFAGFLYSNIKFWVDRFRSETQFTHKHLLSNDRKIYRASLELGIDKHDTSRDSEIADIIGIKKQTLAKWRDSLEASRLIKNPESIVRISNDGEEIDEGSLACLADYSSLDNIDSNREHEERSAFCDTLLSTLKDREALIIRRRFMEDATLEECGKELGITRERVRQIQDAALAKLRRRAEQPKFPQKPIPMVTSQPPPNPSKPERPIVYDNILKFFEAKEPELRARGLSDIELSDELMAMWHKLHKEAPIPCKDCLKTLGKHRTYGNRCQDCCTENSKKNQAIRSKMVNERRYQTMMRRLDRATLLLQKANKAIAKISRDDDKQSHLLDKCRSLNHSVNNIAEMAT